MYHKRERISGHHVPIDVQDGTYGSADLAKKNDARQDDNAKLQKADWPGSMTSSIPEKSDPVLAYAIEHLARPTDPEQKPENHFGKGPKSKGPNPGDDPNDRSKDAGDVGNGKKIIGR